MAKQILNLKPPSHDNIHKITNTGLQELQDVPHDIPHI